jgi:glycosyltransferase involved in cell wall biosynthesis
VFSPGALLPQKGHGRVIRALARLPRASRPPLVLAGFAGRGDTLARLRRLAASSGVELRVHPSPPREELRRILARASVVAVAAVREPFGLVSLEAQASARPLVTVNEGGLPETVVPGETALLASPDPEPLAEAIAILLADPARARALGTAGRDHVRRKFHPERCGEILESALVDGGPPGDASR